MNNNIQTLTKIYCEKRYLRKSLTRNFNKDLLQKLVQLNTELLDSSLVEFNKIIKAGVRNSKAQQNLISIWGDINDDSQNEKGSIISLIQKEKDYIFDLIEEKSEKAFDQKLKELVQLLKAELLLFKKFMKDFFPLYQEKLSLNIIGFGEISTVLEITGGTTFEVLKPDRQKWVFKKMPVFQDLEQAKSLARLYKEYRSLLHEEIGLLIPQQRIQIYTAAPDKIRVYALQRRVNPAAVGHHLIHIFNADECSMLLEMILREFKKVWTFNKKNTDIKVALDGQISNWVLIDFVPGQDTFSGKEKLAYMDTSSPLFRINDEEQLDAEIFLKSTPFFLRPIIRAFFLQEVLDRYYDLHLVTVDLIANFYKEGRAEFIPQMIETANNFFKEQTPDLDVEPLTEEEVTTYYKNDAFIWKFYLAARKIDRFITEKILGKKYEFRLPDHVLR